MRSTHHPGQLNTAAAASPHPTTVRCAIYTRKSTDEGLDRDFNTLDAQREAAEAYVQSQRHEGWTALLDHYDDGGFSGATTDRPGLQRLLADVEAGLIDCVVVYKLDRLSRSMLDFLKILEFFESRGVAFVSVTQQFNTTTSVGRMTMNILLSFAQFEREVIAERTSDKMSAARRKGKWTGGMPPLGYDVAPEGGKLVINEEEAHQVREIFELYVEKRSLLALLEELERRGWRKKSWRTKKGHWRKGGPWDKATLSRLLTDPLYIGLQKLGDETFPGEHEAIVDRDLFDRVQEILDGNRRSGGSRGRNAYDALLRGLVRCAACGAPMNHVTNRRGDRVHRYYRCSVSMKRRAGTCPVRSLRAADLEAFVIDRIRCIGSDPDLRRETFLQAQAKIAAHHRGFKADVKRLEREMARTKREVDQLTGKVSRATGSAEGALLAALGEAQERLSATESRLTEARSRATDVAAQRLDEADLERALADWVPIWEVLHTPEKERILRLLVERVDVARDGKRHQITLTFRPSGIAALAVESES